MAEVEQFQLLRSPTSGFWAVYLGQATKDGVIDDGVDEWDFGAGKHLVIYLVPPTEYPELAGLGDGLSSLNGVLW